MRKHLHNIIMLSLIGLIVGFVWVNFIFAQEPPNPTPGVVEVSAIITAKAGPLTGIGEITKDKKFLWRCDVNDQPFLTSTEIKAFEEIDPVIGAVISCSYQNNNVLVLIKKPIGQQTQWQVVANGVSEQGFISSINEGS